MIGLVLALLSRRLVYLLVPLAAWLGDAISSGIKVAVDRPRPHLDPLVAVPGSPSFPSGHATTSFAAATAIALLRPRLAAPAYLLAVAIAFSRVYVGVHYPLDVAAGAVLGTAVGAAVALTTLRLRGRPRRRRPGSRRRG